MPGAIGSVLRLAGPPSVYCDWVSKFDLQFLAQCGSTKNSFNDSVPGYTLHVAGA